MGQPTDQTPNLWTDLREPLRRFIAKRVRDPHAAEDITQDVMLKVQSHLGELSAPGKLGAWAYQVARNAVTDYYRSTQGRQRVDLGAADEPPAPAPGEQERVTAELAACLRPMIRQLPPAYREALELTEDGGLTQQELADRLGVSLSGAKSRVQRARAQLKTMLLDCCRIETDRRGGVIDHQRTSRSDGYCGGRGGC